VVNPICAVGTGPRDLENGGSVLSSLGVVLSFNVCFDSLGSFTQFNWVLSKVLDDGINQIIDVLVWDEPGLETGEIITCS
jgi:hypothetical protein